MISCSSKIKDGGAANWSELHQLPAALNSIGFAKHRSKYCGSIGNIVQKSTTIMKYIKKNIQTCDCSSFKQKASLTNGWEMRIENVLNSRTVNPLWKVHFTPGVSAVRPLLSHKEQSYYYSKMFCTLTKLLRSPCFAIVLKK